MIEKEDFDEFYKRFVDFRNKNEMSEYDLNDDDIASWFDAVQKNHQKFRNLIGGTSVTYEVEVGDFQNLANINDIDAIINNLLRYIPYYLDENGLKRKDLLNPILPDGQKVSKHISNYTKKKYGAYSSETINKYLAALGEAWSKGKTQPGTWYISILTEAKYFALLGHYGVDNESCFRNDGGHCRDKFVLGECNNSFVSIIHTKLGIDLSTFDLSWEDRDGNQIDAPANYQIASRNWGFHNPKNGTVNFCNYYPKPKFSQANAFEICKSASTQILDIDDSEIQSSYDIVHMGDSGIYLNAGKGTSWTFSQGLEKKITTQYICQ